MTSHATTADDIPTFGSDTPAAPVASIEDEEIDESRLMDHEYDGIREYDNPLPGWWSAVFAATFVFAFLYFAYYDIAHWGRTPDQRYQVAFADLRRCEPDGECVRLAWLETDQVLMPMEKPDTRAGRQAQSRALAAQLDEGRTRAHPASR